MDVYIDPYRLVAFLHVVLFAYWLGADLGVFLCGRFSNRPGISPETRQVVRKVGHLIDMGPRSALVLMVPAGLTLSQQYGFPVSNAVLTGVWLLSLAWLWMVWTIFLRGQEKLGLILWKIDMAVRCVMMLGFLGYGGAAWAGQVAVTDHWLAAKMIVFGLILLDGIILRLLLRRLEAAARAAAAAAPTPVPAGPAPRSKVRTALTASVLLIWFFVALAAFLGVVKPF